MSVATHAAPKPRRRIRKALLIAACLVLVPTVAFAAWFIIVTMKGSVTTAGQPSIRYTGATVLSQSGMNCSTVLDGANDHEVAVNITDALPGGECKLRFSIAKDSGPADTRIQSVSFVSAVQTAFTTSAPCGVVLNGTPAVVDVTIRIPSEIAYGTTFPADAMAGIKLVQGSDYKVADCNVVPPAA
jgi:hypothetical protein